MQIAPRCPTASAASSALANDPHFEPVRLRAYIAMTGQDVGLSDGDEGVGFLVDSGEFGSTRRPRLKQSTRHLNLMLEHGRTNQKRRTRAALVKAALDLLRSGASPTVSEVAHAALVSPATAYRYFPSARALWTAVLAEMGGPSVEDVFAGVPERDAEARVEAMIRAVGFRMFDDEALWRTAARLLHERHPSGAAGSADERIPVPTGKRLRLIECALAPLARELPKGAHRRLLMSLALVMGAETVLALRDVCELEPEEAKAVALWAGRAMVRAALAEQQQRRGERPSAKPAARKPSRKHG